MKCFFSHNDFKQKRTHNATSMNAIYNNFICYTLSSLANEYPVSSAQADSQLCEFKFYINIINGHEKKGREGKCRVCSTVSVLHVKSNGIIIIYIQKIEVVINKQ